MIILNYILFVNYEKVNYHTTTNVEENLNIPIEENPDEPVEENLDIPIEENSQTKFQKVDMSLLQLQHDPWSHRQIYTYHIDQWDKIDDVTLSWVHTSLFLKIFKNLKRIEAFKVLGMKMTTLSRGLNILQKKMPLFVYHAFSFISQLGMMEKIHSQLMDSQLTPLIDLSIKRVKIWWTNLNI